MNKTEQLRSLPAVDELLRCDQLKDEFRYSSRPQLVRWIRLAIDQCRQQVLRGQPPASLFDDIVHRVRRCAAEDRGQVIQKVINATGVLLHTNLGRAPLPKLAIERMGEAVAYANVELNLRTGKRSKRGERVERLLAELTGAEAALVVNNCAAATLLVLQAVAGGREVIISRGQLVEIGGGFRLPDVFRAAGVLLREVGTTNRTYLHDYEHACGEQTGAIIRVHRSNFRQTGFVTEPSIDEMIGANRPPHVPVIDDLGSGSVLDLSAYGLAEPSVRESVAAGADLVLFSGDKLFGGPQAGMIVGKRRWVDVLRKTPMMRAVRVDKVTLAALEATTEIHLSGNALTEVPLLQMIARQPSELRANCERVINRLPQITDFRVDIVACEAQVGGGAVPGISLPSFAIRISGPNSDELAQRLRLGAPAVQSRVTDGSLLLDLRSVADDDLGALTTRLCQTLKPS